MNISGPSSPRADIDSVLAQIRSMQANTQGELKRAMRAADVAPNREAPAVRSTDFGDMLGGALKSVNALQQASAKASNDFVTGKSKDLVGTMLASQKANIAFQATTQVRNRVVSAYQDIMNMPI